jgi:hypothetical protein
MVSKQLKEKQRRNVKWRSRRQFIQLARQAAGENLFIAAINARLSRCILAIIVSQQEKLPATRGKTVQISVAAWRGRGVENQRAYNLQCQWP